MSTIFRIAGVKEELKSYNTLGGRQLFRSCRWQGRDNTHSPRSRIMWNFEPDYRMPPGVAECLIALNRLQPRGRSEGY